MVVTSIGLVSFSCMLGAALPEYIKNINLSHTKHQLIHAFTNGMLLGMALLFFMPEIIEHAQESPSLMAFMGMAMLLTKLLANASESAQNNQQRLTVVLYASLMFHNLIECILLGYYVGQAIGITWLIAIAAHKWAETCCINIRLIEFNYHSNIRLLLIGSFILVSIVSILLGFYLYNLNTSLIDIHDYAIFALLITTGYLIESSLDLDQNTVFCQDNCNISKSHQIGAMMLGLFGFSMINAFVGLI